jgi:hypothetical protein
MFSLSFVGRPPVGPAPGSDWIETLPRCAIAARVVEAINHPRPVGKKARGFFPGARIVAAPQPGVETAQGTASNPLI